MVSTTILVSDMLGEGRPNLRGWRRVGWLRLRLGGDQTPSRGAGRTPHTDRSGWTRSAVARPSPATGAFPAGPTPSPLATETDTPFRTPA
ncbi:hypothetical protein [Microvirga sp. VF16]|uniref:hypothetical protein n=1 Tax=Microvirga sp. VF16 TaxID=2807101 RepID=UPI00193D1017|nr:hypothetical protein [Microvirga sp. VF16]QRM32373.1 hypothetical protein JO965_30140 [Microvirga sp. VF16]